MVRAVILIAVSLLGASADAEAAGGGEHPWIVSGARDLGTLQGDVVSLGATVVDASPDLGAALVRGLDAMGIHRLRNAGYEVAEDVPIHASALPDDPLWSQQWGPPAARIPQAWEAHGFQGVSVAVLDGGIDFTHPDLKDAVCGRGPDFTGGDWATSMSPHGTHVAGIIAARTNNGEGTAGVTDACVLDVRVLDSSGAGDSWALARAIAYAADAGARIISLSLGGSNLPPVVHAAVARAALAGVVIVAAAGNNGCPAAGADDEPASYPEVIAVGALRQQSSGAITLDPSSGCGPKVELAAPGIGIVSTWPGDAYATLSGTSMSVPFVSGVASLLLGANPNLTAVQVRCALDRGSAPPPPQEIGRYIGRLDAAGAFEHLAGCVSRLG